MGKFVEADRLQQGKAPGGALKRLVAKGFDVTQVGRVVPEPGMKIEDRRADAGKLIGRQAANPALVFFDVACSGFDDLDRESAFDEFVRRG